YAEAEGFLHDADNSYEVIRPDWMDLFLDGSRPSEWPDEVPSKDEIIEALVEQEKRIETFFTEKYANKADHVRDVNGIMLDTVAHTMQLVTWQDVIHLGIIISIRLAID